jgi:preprotein translocase subunit SecD
MRVVLAGLLIVLCLGCGGGEGDGEPFAIYHLETAIGPPGKEGELWCGPPTVVCPGVVKQPPPRVFRYAVRAAPAVTGEELDRSSVRQDIDPDDRPVVVLELTVEGRRAFAELTQEAARFGARDQALHHIVVVVGDEIVAFPGIDFDAYPDGISAQSGVQVGVATVSGARDLVRRLRGG